MEDFITTLFNTKKENGELNIQDDELNEWNKKLEQANKELFNLVSEKLDEKYQTRFNQLMLEIEETNRCISDITEELYYKAGVKQGAEIYETLKSK